MLNVPLENIQWNVVAPQGYELADHDGNADLSVKNACLNTIELLTCKSHLSLGN